MTPVVKPQHIKSIFFVLFAAMLADSFYAPRGSTPGYAGALFLAWAFFTRFFLPPPPYKLILLAGICALACLASNHSLIALKAPLRSFYLYLICGVLIAWWEKIGRFFQADHNVDHQR
jgi:hypothetical protein